MNGKTKNYVNKDMVNENSKSLLNSHKVFISEAYGIGNSIEKNVIGTPFIGEPNTCCSMTYLVVGDFETKPEAQSVCDYMKTKFFRFMVSLRKTTQHGSIGVYSFVPMVDLTKSWTDRDLYKEFDLTAEQIKHIETTIRAYD